MSLLSTVIEEATRYTVKTAFSFPAMLLLSVSEGIFRGLEESVHQTFETKK